MTTAEPYTDDVGGFIYYKKMAEQAAKAAHSAAHGVCVTVDYFNGDYKFVIWTIWLIVAAIRVMDQLHLTPRI